jgi:cytidylate kinase
MLRSHKERDASDKLRYIKYYQKDCFDKNNFDFVVDTTNLSPEEVFDTVWDYIEGKTE